MAGVTMKACWAKRFKDGVTEAPLARVGDSEGNFVLADFGAEAKANAANDFLRSRGLIVRGVRGYGLPTCLRITVGTAEEVRLVIDALTEFSRRG